jgi:hypothetical protein
MPRSLEALAAQADSLPGTGQCESEEYRWWVVWMLFEHVPRKNESVLAGLPARLMRTAQRAYVIGMIRHEDVFG